MNRVAFADKLADKLGLPSRAAGERVLAALFDPDEGIIADAIKGGEAVTLPGFGVFEARDIPARTHRNPETGGAVHVAAHRRPAFRPGAGLKRRIRD